MVAGVALPLPGDSNPERDAAAAADSTAQLLVSARTNMPRRQLPTTNETATS